MIVFDIFLIGWGGDSYGVGSDGKLREEDFDDQSPVTMSSEWLVGDVIGVGIDFTNSKFFTTRNGFFLGTPANLYFAFFLNFFLKT